MGIAAIVASSKVVQNLFGPMAFRGLQLKEHAIAELSISAANVRRAMQSAVLAEHQAALRETSVFAAGKVVEIVKLQLACFDAGGESSKMLPQCTLHDVTPPTFVVVPYRLPLLSAIKLGRRHGAVVTVLKTVQNAKTGLSLATETESLCSALCPATATGVVANGTPPEQPPIPKPRKRRSAHQLRSSCYEGLYFYKR